MIKITRQEADKIRKQLPNAQVVTVNKTKSYKKYWAEESRPVMRLLNDMRGIAPVYKAQNNNRNWQRKHRG